MQRFTFIASLAAAASAAALAPVAAVARPQRYTMELLDATGGVIDSVFSITARDGVIVGTLINHGPRVAVYGARIKEFGPHRALRFALGPACLDRHDSLEVSWTVHDVSAKHIWPLQAHGNDTFQFSAHLPIA